MLTTLVVYFRCRYQEFGDWIRNCYGSAIVSSPGNNQSVIVLTLPTSNQITDRVWIREDQVLNYLSDSTVA